MNKKIYWTSDWHIGHKAVIDFSNRPFKDCDDMHRVLINNYNSTVGTHDICCFPVTIRSRTGDLSYHDFLAQVF